MLNRLRHLVFIGSLFVWSAAATDAGNRVRTEDLRYWPQWRGPLASGVAPLAHPPIHWSERENIRWKIALPGQGHSSPIVFGDSVFVTVATPVGEAQKPV